MKNELINLVPECKDLPRVSYVFSGQQQPAHAVGGLTTDGSAILWLGFAFESVSWIFNMEYMSQNVYAQICSNQKWINKVPAL